MKYEVVRRTFIMKKDIKKKPTEAELNILRILWERGASTVREVHETLYPNNSVGYTTTLKLMQIMVDKSLTIRDTSQRTHIYTASLAEEQNQKRMVKDLLQDAFKGSPSKLVMQILGNHQASAEELDEIKALINKIEKNQ